MRTWVVFLWDNSQCFRGDRLNKVLGIVRARDYEAAVNAALNEWRGEETETLEVSLEEIYKEVIA